MIQAFTVTLLEFNASLNKSIISKKKNRTAYKLSHITVYGILNAH